MHQIQVDLVNSIMPFRCSEHLTHLEQKNGPHINFWSKTNHPLFSGLVIVDMQEEADNVVKEVVDQFVVLFDYSAVPDL